MKKEYIALNQSVCQDISPVQFWGDAAEIAALARDGMDLRPPVINIPYMRAIDLLPLRKGRYNLDIKFKCPVVPAASKEVYFGILFPKPHSGAAGVSENRYTTWYGPLVQLNANFQTLSSFYEPWDLAVTPLGANAGDLSDAGAAHGMSADVEYHMSMKLDLDPIPMPLNSGEPAVSLGLRFKAKAIMNGLIKNTYGNLDDTRFSKSAFAVAVVGVMHDTVTTGLTLMFSDFKHTTSVVDEVKEVVVQ